MEEQVRGLLQGSTEALRTIDASSFCKISADEKQAWLLTLFALNGMPLLIFATFSIGTVVVVFSIFLVLTLVLTLIVAGLVILIAFLILLPVLFICTIAAGFIFGSGLSAFLAYRRLRPAGSPPLLDRQALTKKFQELSDGKVDGLINGALQSEKLKGALTKTIEGIVQAQLAIPEAVGAPPPAL
jgi:hypothetical protein